MSMVCMWCVCVNGWENNVLHEKFRRRTSGGDHDCDTHMEHPGMCAYGREILFLRGILEQLVWEWSAQYMHQPGIKDFTPHTKWSAYTRAVLVYQSSTYLLICLSKCAICHWTRFRMRKELSEKLSGHILFRWQPGAFLFGEWFASCWKKRHEKHRNCAHLPPAWIEQQIHLHVSQILLSLHERFDHQVFLAFSSHGSWILDHVYQRADLLVLYSDAHASTRQGPNNKQSSVSSQAEYVPVRKDVFCRWVRCLHRIFHQVCSAYNTIFTAHTKEHAATIEFTFTSPPAASSSAPRPGVCGSAASLVLMAFLLLSTPEKSNISMGSCG